MSNIQRIMSISHHHRICGLAKPDHPLISVVDYSTIKHSSGRWVLDFYLIAVKRGMACKMDYGQQRYDFDEGVMFFISPDQVFGIEPESDSARERSGWMLLIHPDFLWGTSLVKKIKKYEFFGYSTNEALFLSAREETAINGIVQTIQKEYHSNIDKFSQNIIISQFETLLNYSDRFYERQFITRKITNHKILESFEDILTYSFEDDQLSANGLPTVAFIAERLNLSSRYLSSLLKMLTGQTVQNHIHHRLIERAKVKLSTTDLSVSEIAFGLGFEHAQSFSKLFKKRTQNSPSKFRRTFQN